MRNLSSSQLVVLVAAFILLGSLVLLGQYGYTLPRTKKGAETAQESKASLTEDIVLAEARNTLDSAQAAYLAALDEEKAASPTILQEAEVLKLISREWYNFGQYLVAGYYAKKVAELLDSGEAWGIAGTTYGKAFREEKANDRRQLAALKAIEALERAKEIEPDTLRHAINEGLMYLELSSVDATVPPMKGVGMLRDLDQQNPDNILINMTLGRLSALRSGDLAKAKPRFEKVLEIAERKKVPNSVLLEAHYFLVDCYKNDDNKSKVLYHYDKMIELSANQPGIQSQMERAKDEYINN